MSRSRVVVLGTGTGIGKTHVGVALLRALASGGLSVAGLKPIESGVGSGTSDAELLREAGTFHVKQPPPYVFAEPVSPHLAARHAGRRIEIPPVLSWIELSEADVTIVETAGAMLSPLSSSLTNLSLAAALAPDFLLLVAPDRLGVLHDVRAALLAFRALAPWLPQPCVVLQAPAQVDASTGTNAAELELLGVTDSVTCFPRAAMASTEARDAGLRLAQRLGVMTAHTAFHVKRV